MAVRCGVRAELFYRLADRALRGAQGQGSGVQRFSGVRDDGGRIVLFRPVAGELRLVRGQHGGVSAGAAGADACVVRAAVRVASGVRISRSEYLTLTTGRF